VACVVEAGYSVGIEAVLVDEVLNVLFQAFPAAAVPTSQNDELVLLDIMKPNGTLNDRFLKDWSGQDGALVKRRPVLW
jgi:hypothetical protein